MVILAKGKVAAEAYNMPYTGQPVYSIEELCCYICHNIYAINEDFFQLSLTDWLREQLDMPVLADKLTYMIREEHGMKDLVVAVLCSCDYYRENEVRRVVEILDNIANLPVYKKKKIKADNYLRAEQYGRSLREYRKLLQGSFAINFTPEEYGDILHNQGIAHFYTSSFEVAMEDFKEAYVRNNKQDSLKHYLWILLMQDEKQKFEAEALHFGLKEEEADSIRLRYQEIMSGFSMSAGGKKNIEKYKEQLRQAFAY